MNRAAIQGRIDEVTWYHDFDFGGGLVARTQSADADEHRRMWRFIEGELGRIDFTGRTVLDLGCWDGYWSFYAERRGAASVLASDDATQNWAGRQGLLLARELLGSRVETKLDQSVYDLASLERTFDVILCLGVYHHLLDPYYALAQIRHCCHHDTVVVLEGNVIRGLPEWAAYFEPGHRSSKYSPTACALRGLLEAAYFDVTHAVALGVPPQDAPKSSLGWRWRLAMAWQVLCGHGKKIARHADTACRSHRELWVCKPFVAENDAHAYPPPFGLWAYDRRWGRLAA